MDLIKVSNIMVEKIKKEYASDIAVMCLYGSYVYKSTHEKSDLDFYFIPKTRRGFKMARSFIIDEIGFDLWPLTWKRAEAIAHYREHIVTVIADAQVVYYSSKESLERFRGLQSVARNPEGKVNFESIVETRLNESYKIFYSILENKDDFSSARLYAIKLLNILVEIVALANHTYIRRGWEFVLKEVSSMRIVPDNFISLFAAVLYADNTGTIIDNSLKLIHSARNAASKPGGGPVNVKKAFNMFYEEMKSTYNKIYHACDTRDMLKAALAGAVIQTEIIDIIGSQAYRNAGFIDIISCFSNNDLQTYKKAALSHDEQFENYLVSNGVSISRYKTMDEFEKGVNK